MEITDLPNLRDRRLAASDENPSGYPRRNGFRIQAVILHQSTGHSFLPLTTAQAEGLIERQRRSAARRVYPLNSDDDIRVSSRHRLLDGMRSHFVILGNGVIFYTHDIRRLSGSAGGRHGIDIEFAGNFSADNRLSREAILSGRNLVRGLKRSIPSIGFIHPHGQIQKYLMSRDENNNPISCDMDQRTRMPNCGKFHSCPGPDIWVNVGVWAVAELVLICNEPIRYYQNNGISARQSDATFERDSGFLAIPSNPF